MPSVALEASLFLAHTVAVSKASISSLWSLHRRVRGTSIGLPHSVLNRYKLPNKLSINMFILEQLCEVADKKPTSAIFA